MMIRDPRSVSLSEPNVEVRGILGNKFCDDLQVEGVKHRND